MAVEPRLILRAVKLAADTELGLVGNTTRFSKGFNVVRADNSSGKSTILQAIVYALGVEGMLGARHDVPLPHAMTDRVSVNGTDAEVVTSSVALEIENADGEIATVTRQVKHPTIETSLISVASGPALTGNGDYATQDYFVRRPGSAVREAGFHHFLTGFIGWTLPQVMRFDGSECPLYLETIFPYIYVEQKHGWSGVQARIPTYLGIRDVGKRSAEFLLDLEAHQRVLAAQRISSSIGLIEQRWKEVLAELATKAHSAGAALAGPPTRVSDSLSEDGARLVVYVSDTWKTIGETVEALSADLARLESHPVAEVGPASSPMETDLETAEHEVMSVLTHVGVVIEERTVLAGRREELELRIGALEEDLQRQKDALTLTKLGSSIAESLVGERVCPTCHQDVHDGMDISAHAMTALDNVAYIERQLATFTNALHDVGRSLNAMELREASLRSKLSSQRRKVRTIRDALLQCNTTPSAADVAERVELRDKIESLSDSQQELEMLRTRLGELAREHDEQRKALASIKVSQLSDADSSKLAALEAFVKGQLERYHFASLPPADIEISRDTYRPVYEGFDLGFDLSASDMIRVIWSYLLAMMRVSEEQSGRHPGLLIFDEPRQQETAPQSYRELLREAAEHGARGSQLIFATSEASEALVQMLGSEEYNLVDVPPGEKLLRLIDDDSSN